MVIIKAITVFGPNDLRMTEVNKPRVRPKDTLVKVAYCGICGTDISILCGDMSEIRDGLIKYPVRIGHEWSGVIEEVGSEVKNFKIGDRVVSDSGVTCGKCVNCTEGDYRKCRNAKSVGTVNCWDGAFAEYILMPERHLFKVPDSIDLDEAALIEPAAIALSGLKECKIEPDSTVLIIGTGPIGLATILLAKQMGAAKVLISGRKQHKLEICKSVGADVVINITQENLVDAVMQATGGVGVDAIVETSGSYEVLDDCMDALKNYLGIITLIGFYNKEMNHFNISKLINKSVRLIGILGKFELPQEVINLMTAGNISFKPLITHRFTFDEAIDAMKTASEKNDTKIKMIVEISK